LSPAVGTFKGAPCQESQPPWHADRFSVYRKRVVSFGVVRETSTLKTEHFSCLIAVRRLKYCVNGVEPLLMYLERRYNNIKFLPKCTNNENLSSIQYRYTKERLIYMYLTINYYYRIHPIERPCLHKCHLSPFLTLKNEEPPSSTSINTVQLTQYR
jgi:hypothetical protein